MRGWSSVVPSDVAGLYPELLEGTPGLPVLGQWECSAKLLGKPGADLPRPGSQQGRSLAAPLLTGDL